MLGKLFQKISKVLVWLQIVRSCGLCDAVSDSAGAGSADGINQIPVVFSQTEGSYPSFRRIVIDWNKRIF